MFRPIKKRSFALLCVLDLINRKEKDRGKRGSDIILLVGDSPAFSFGLSASFLR